MQTFLPYPDFQRSAVVLDRQRLGKQRVEAGQILRALGVKVPRVDFLDPVTGRTPGWVNHPATRMWRGFETALCAYHDAIVHEWVERGYQNSMPLLWSGARYDLPPWFGDPDFHASHRSNLLRKLPEFYWIFGWSEPPNLEYVWPV